MGDWRGHAFPPLAPGPPPHPFAGLAPQHPGAGVQQQQHVHPPLSSLFAAVGSPPHHHLHHPVSINLLHSPSSSSSAASDQSKAAAAAVKVKQACLPCKKAHTACDESRPCKKCVELGKADQCVDVERKKAGRPKKKPAPPPPPPPVHAGSPTSTSATPAAAAAAAAATASPGGNKPQHAGASPHEPARKRARVEGQAGASHTSTPSPLSPPPAPTSQPPPPPPPQSQPQPHQHSHMQQQQQQQHNGGQPPPMQQQQQQQHFGFGPAGGVGGSTAPGANPEKDLTNSAVSFLLDQVRMLSNTVESLRHEVNQLKANQHAASSSHSLQSPSPFPFSPSTTTTTASSSSASLLPFSCPSPMPYSSSSSSSSQSTSTACAPSVPTPPSPSSSAPSPMGASAYSSPPAATPFSSSAATSPPLAGGTVATSSYTTHPDTQHQYIPIAALPHCHEMMAHFSFLLAFDLQSSYLPFVVDDISKPVCVVRSPPAGDDTIPPVFYYVNRPMADLLLYRVDELLGNSVLGIYAPDDKTKIQLMPHVKDLPFSPIILFSPLCIRKDGTIIRMATRLQTFSHRRLTPDWTIIVVDGIEEVGATLGTSSMYVPQLPKWLGQNTTAFLKSVLSMTARPRSKGGATVYEFPSPSPEMTGGMLGHNLRRIQGEGASPSPSPQPHTSPMNHHHQHQHHHQPLPPVSLEEVEENGQMEKQANAAAGAASADNADLNELLTQLMPSSVFTPDYASWITDSSDYPSTGEGGSGAQHPPPQP